MFYCMDVIGLFYYAQPNETLVASARKSSWVQIHKVHLTLAVVVNTTCTNKLKHVMIDTQDALEGGC